MSIVTVFPDSTLQIREDLGEEGGESTDSEGLQVLVSQDLARWVLTLRFDDLSSYLGLSLISAKLLLDVEDLDSGAPAIGTPEGRDFLVRGFDIDEAVPTTMIGFTTRRGAVPESITIEDSEIPASSNTLEIDVLDLFEAESEGTTANIYIHAFEDAFMEATYEFNHSNPRLQLELPGSPPVDLEFELEKTLDDVTLDSEVEVLIQAELDKTLDDVTLQSFFGDEGFFLLIKTLEGATLDAELTTATGFSLDVTLDGATLDADYMDEPPILGFLTKTLDDVTLDSETEVLIQANLLKTLDGVTLTANFNSENPFLLQKTLEDASLTAILVIGDSGKLDRSLFPKMIFLGNKQNAIFDDHS